MWDQQCGFWSYRCLNGQEALSLGISLCLNGPAPFGGVLSTPTNVICLLSGWSRMLVDGYESVVNHQLASSTTRPVGRLRWLEWIRPYKMAQDRSGKEIYQERVLPDHWDIDNSKSHIVGPTQRSGEQKPLVTMLTPVVYAGLALACR